MDSKWFMKLSVDQGCFPPQKILARHSIHYRSFYVILVWTERRGQVHNFGWPKGQRNLCSYIFLTPWVQYVSPQANLGQDRGFFRKSIMHSFSVYMVMHTQSLCAYGILCHQFLSDIFTFINNLFQMMQSSINKIRFATAYIQYLVFYEQPKAKEKLDF